MSKLIFVQKLLHFEVRDFGRISNKEIEKSQILWYFTPNVSGPSIFAQISWNLDQMFPPYRGTKPRKLFWKFWKLAVLCQFFTKNGLKIAIFRPFFVKNWHKIANFQNFQKSSLNFVSLYDGNIWCKFQLI